MSTPHRLASARAHPVPVQTGLHRWAGHRPQADGDGASQDWHRAPEEDAPNRCRADRPRKRTGVEYRCRRGGHELVLSLHGLTDLRAEAVAGGEAELALVVEGPLLVLGDRFGAAFPWAATARFHWQGLPPEARVVPPEVELTPASSARLGARSGSPSSRPTPGGSELIYFEGKTLLGGATPSPSRSHEAPGPQAAERSVPPRKPRRRSNRPEAGRGEERTITKPTRKSTLRAKGGKA